MLEFLTKNWHWILSGIAALIILIKFLPRYKIASPDTALIISGLIRRSYKVREGDGTVSNVPYAGRHQNRSTRDSLPAGRYVIWPAMN